MAIVFKNKGTQNISQTFINVFQCEDPSLYSIIFGFSLSNNINDIIRVSVRVVSSDGLTSSYIVSDTKINPNTTLTLAGDEQKIIVKPGEKLEAICSDIDGVSLFISYTEEDPSIEYFGPVPVWYGDFGVLWGGGSYTSVMNSYDFISTTVNKGYISISDNYSYSTGCSNGIIGLRIGGSSYVDNISAIEFSSANYTMGFSRLLYGTYWGGTSSDTINHYTFGGYYYKLNIQRGSFTAGETCINFGSLTSSYRGIGANGNNVYGLCLSANQTSAQYIIYASQSIAAIWGNMYNGQYYRSSAATEDILIYPRGGSSSGYNQIDSFDLSAQSNYTQWGVLASTNYEMGCIHNGDDVLFTCGEYPSNASYKFNFATAGTGQTLSSTLFSNFDGEYNQGCSGNA